jgi:hypothetical protein
VDDPARVEPARPRTRRDRARDPVAAQAAQGDTLGSAALGALRKAPDGRRKELRLTVPGNVGLARPALGTTSAMRHRLELRVRPAAAMGGEQAVEALAARRQGRPGRITETV